MWNSARTIPAGGMDAVRAGGRHGGLFSLQTCLEQMVCVKWHPRDPSLNQGFRQLNVKPSVSQTVGFIPASGLAQKKPSQRV